MIAHLLQQMYMSNTKETWTLKEIDEQHGVVKGTSFRAFKAVRASLTEGVDFLYINGDQCPEQIQQLKQSRRLYASSVHAVLFKEKAYQQIKQALITL